MRICRGACWLAVAWLVLVATACTGGGSPASTPLPSPSGSFVTRPQPRRTVERRRPRPGGADDVAPPRSLPRCRRAGVRCGRRRPPHRAATSDRRRGARRDDAPGRDDQLARTRRTHGDLAAGQPGRRPPVPDPRLGVPRRGVRHRTPGSRTTTSSAPGSCPSTGCRSVTSSTGWIRSFRGTARRTSAPRGRSSSPARRCWPVSASPRNRSG